ncbi:MAG TPA: DUF488 domain-containing protein [Nostocaceae cyanobacterium]|nr:DUF488 domain-containing protein [Nostocaceae cyanobacterium]
MELFTIGHSNHTIEAFIGLLNKHQITALADVRSHPYSRYLPHFNKSQLQNNLKTANIHYVFLGQELGARPNNPECYIDGKVVYEKIAETESFKIGIQRLLKGVEKYRIALMCAEKDPFVCHRALLICQHLRNIPNLEINHIKSDSSLEAHHTLEERLLNKHNCNQQLASVSTSLQLSLIWE